MSGGHFNYKQDSISDIADSIEKIIEEDQYPIRILFKMHEAVLFLRLAAVMANRIDFLVSRDDSEDTFLERWKEDVGEITSNPPDLTGGE